MRDIPGKNSLTEIKRPIDISSWQEVDTAPLITRERRIFEKRKTAVAAYLTTNRSINYVTTQHHLSPQLLLKLARQCLMQHEDGLPWGYRALVPGTNVLDHTPQPSTISPAQPLETPLPDLALNDEDAPLDNTIEAANHETPLPAIAPPAIDPLPSIHEQLAPIEETPSSNSTHDPPPTAKETALMVLPKPEIHNLVPWTPDLTPQPIAPVHSSLSPMILRRPGQVGIKKIAQLRRIIAHKRELRYLQKKNSQRQLYRLISLVILIVLLLGTLIPLGVGLAAYNIYSSMNTMTHDGMNYLLMVKTLLPFSMSDPMAALDATKLQQAQDEFKAAEGDFAQLQQMANRPDLQVAVQQVSPNDVNKLTSAKHLLQVALDVSRMGQELTAIGLIAANVVHGSPLAAASTKPLVTTADVTAITGTMVHALYYIDDIQAHMSQVQLKDIPISDKQKAQLVGLLAQLPKARTMITQAQGVVGTIAWLLGVGHERRFLVQTMDRAELRPSGGFTGQYGILQIQDGRMAPLSLRDVALLDYGGNGVELGRPAPPEYSSWMNFGNWGLRDSNLSGDYPTTARMSMQVFQEEGGGPVDGDISFTPTFIGHILDVTGPVHVADGYNETITSQNLEERLHYYQQNYTAIAKEQQIANDYSHQARKTFTSLLGRMLLDKVRHLPTKQLLNVIKNATRDIQSRDLEIYFTNPTAEQWLTDHGYNGAIDPYSKQDGLMVVQANISISKASTYVHTTEQDDVVLDSQGGATHNLTITLDYEQTGPVYGFDTYADYIRVYAPQSAQYIDGNGFDSGQAICKPAQPQPGKKNNDNGNSSAANGNADNGSNGNGSDQQDKDCNKALASFPSSLRYCPDRHYSLGDRYFHQPWPVDSLGSPTARTSDLPGRSMWGGLTVTPKNCFSYITLSWYVPNAVKHTTKGKPIYTLLVQKQGGYIPTLDLSINTDAIKALKPLHTSIDLTVDKTFTLQ